MTSPAHVTGDPHDARWLAELLPPGRQNPKAAPHYAVVVVGGGPAGLVVAMGAAGLGAKVAIIEAGLLGGDCLNVGCVPSKALLAAGHAAHATRGRPELGVDASAPADVDFERVMAHVREVRSRIAHHDGVARLEAAGVDVFLGRGTFVARDAVEVDGQRISFARAVIATGARAALPPIPGLAEADPLTNETVFALTRRPTSLVILGAGPIGVELGQAMARLGTRVTLVDQASQLLPREDADASAVVALQLQADGIVLRLGTKIVSVNRAGERTEVVVEGPEGPETLIGERVLVALGRQANVDGLGLAAAGVQATPRNVIVDDWLRTTNPHIFAAGDITGLSAFTHTADTMARIVLQNLLFVRSRRWSSAVVPTVAYTQPELGRVGPEPAALAERSDLQVFTVEMSDVDRGRTERATAGFARVHVDPRGRIVAGTVVGEGAGETLHLLVLAMSRGIRVGSLASVMFAYPTRAEVVRKLGDAYNRQRLTPRTASWIRRWIGWWLGPWT